MTLLDKVIDGSICCALEEEEGIGCLKPCPYSKHGRETATCRYELKDDIYCLRKLLEYNAEARLNDLLREKETLERELKTTTAFNVLFDGAKRVDEGGNDNG